MPRQIICPSVADEGAAASAEVGGHMLAFNLICGFSMSSCKGSKALRLAIPRRSACVPAWYER